MHSKKGNDFERLVHRVDSVWDGELAPAHIKTVEDELAHRQQLIFEKYEVLEAQVKEALATGTTDHIERDTNEFRRMQYEYGRPEMTM